MSITLPLSPLAIPARSRGSSRRHRRPRSARRGRRCLDRSLEQAEPDEDDIANRPARNSALDRAGAEVMRRNAFSEAEIVAKFGYVPDRIIENTVIQQAYNRGLAEGFAKGLAEARAHGAVMMTARIVVAMAVQHFGQACVVRLLEDGQLHVEATSEKNASLDAQIEFIRDLREVLGDREIVVTARPPGYEPTAIDRLAVERGVVLT